MSGIDSELVEFSYNQILEKMMKKNPVDRYQSFTDVKAAIEKKDFINIQISKKDKEIYQAFTNAVYDLISKYTNDPKFVHDPAVFIQRLETALKNNLFEDKIQDKKDIINSIIASSCKFYLNKDISCEVVRDFLNWYKACTEETQKIILSNIISKLSIINVEYDFMDLPFN